MRHCFYHTDLRQNTVFHNFAIQIALIKYSGRWKHAWDLAKPLKKFPKSPIRPAGSQQFWQVPNEWKIIVTLQQSKEFIMSFMFIIIMFFLFDGFITMCNLRKRLIRAAFWVLLQAVFMNDWKQTAQQSNLQERQRKINKINIIRWNIYRDNNYHSRRQELKSLWKSWVFKLKA